jgi:hypothetical protein
MWYTLCLVIGTALLIGSLLMLKKSMAFLKNSERATATVVDLQMVSGSDGDTYKPVFVFKTYANQEITYRSGVSSSPPAWEIGEEATIAYDRNAPATAQLLTYWGSFRWSIILACIAMPLLIIGGGYHLAQRVLH